MNKRLWIIIFGACVLVAIIAFAIVIFIVPAFTYVFAAIVFLLSGGFQLFTGTILTQQAKERGESIPWSKQTAIVIALGFGCLAAMTLTRQFTSDLIIISLFFLLSLCLFIYATYLGLRQAAQMKNLNNR